MKRINAVVCIEEKFDHDGQLTINFETGPYGIVETIIDQEQAKEMISVLQNAFELNLTKDVK